MKKNTIQLDVDLIGSQEPLTRSEEIALSDYFKNKKKIIKQKSNKPRKSFKKESEKILVFP